MINRAGRFWTRKEIKRRVKSENGKLDGIWFAGPHFRLVYNIREDQPDYYLAIWRVKSK